MDFQKGVVQEIIPRTVTKHPNVKEALRLVLELPLTSPHFKNRVASNSSYAIIVENPHSFKNSLLMLDSVLSYLRSMAVQSHDISIIITSTDGQEIDITKLNQILRTFKEQEYSFHIHNREASKNLENLGSTPTYDTPIFVNKIFARADFTIGIGHISPDTFLGVTGGRMAVIPGICGQKTVERTTELTIQGNIGPLIVTNPVNIDMIETSKIANLQFILNAVPDWKGTIADFVSGSQIKAWRNGIETAKKLSTRVVNQRTDIVFVSAGGTPCDSTLFNSIDSLNSALMVSRRDGVIVLIAECAQGLGPDGFRNGIFNSESEEDILESIRFNFSIGMEKAWYLRKIMDSRKLIICSRLKESLINERILCDAVKDPQDGLELARQYVGMNAEISIIPKGKAVVPVFH